MERRIVIKQVLILAAGLTLLPSCLKQQGKSTVLLKNLNVSLDQEYILAEIAETLIPKTDTPGAKQLNLHLFVLKMLDDCYENSDQKKFMSGLGQFEDHTHQLYNKSFKDLPRPQQLVLLNELDHQQDIVNDLSVFYKILKSRTIDGYLNSKYVMTNLIIWELVPGRYTGYFPVKSA